MSTYKISFKKFIVTKTPPWAEELGLQKGMEGYFDTDGTFIVINTKITYTRFGLKKSYVKETNQWLPETEYTVL